jgi:hypothetical protein
MHSSRLLPSIHPSSFFVEAFPDTRWSVVVELNHSYMGATNDFFLLVLTSLPNWQTLVEGLNRPINLPGGIEFLVKEILSVSALTYLRIETTQCRDQLQDWIACHYSCSIIFLYPNRILSCRCSQNCKFTISLSFRLLDGTEYFG